MHKNFYFILLACGICFLFIMGPSMHLAWGETHVESTMEMRSTVFLQVEAAELKKWVPESMQIAPFPKGPFKGANLFIAFIDRLLGQDPQGKPFMGGTARNAVFVVPAKHNQTGEMVYPVIYGLTDNPQNVPGPYKISRGASIRREYNHAVSALNSVEGSDAWEVKNSSDVLIDFHIKYEREVPRRLKAVLKIYSGVEPEFYRIYKTDYLMDLLKSIPAKIDRVKEYRLKVSVPELGKLLNGTEQLVAIYISPVFVRDVFLP